MATAQSAIQLTDAQKSRVQAHLEELLASSAFSGSRRRQAFLRYVVEETLAGRGHAIKESNIAVDVFERNVDFDAQSESIVRVTGGEVRKRLAQSYTSGFYSDVHIELPLGSYQPNIQFVSAPAFNPAVEIPAELIPAASGRRPGALWVAVGLAAIGAFALAAGALRSPTPLDRVWAPFVGQSNPVVVALAVPIGAISVSEPSKWLPLKPKTAIPTESLQDMDSAYVGTGGALGAARFAEQLASRQQRFSVMLASDMAFADLKAAPSIMVGASRWTRELHANTRFHLENSNGVLTILDSLTGQSWETARHRGDRVEGYCLVTRLMNSDSGNPMLLVVGIDDRNTQAGVEFLSDPTKFAKFASSAPRGWEQKNFQVVLHSTIHGTSAGSLAVVSSHVW